MHRFSAHPSSLGTPVVQDNAFAALPPRSTRRCLHGPDPCPVLGCCVPYILPSPGDSFSVQDGVPTAIATLLEAGVRVWMITGDKQETAINIGVSCKLVSNPETIMILNVDEKKEHAVCTEEARSKLHAMLQQTEKLQVGARYC